MKLSTRTRYGTRALLEMALHWDEGPILMRDIAQRQDVSLPYLEQLIGPLVAGGIVRSTRGAKGGVELARPPQEVKLSEVIGILEGSLAPADCLKDPSVCDRSQSCVTRDIWHEMGQAMNSVLEANTLQDLVERNSMKASTKEAMYHI